MRYTRTDYYYFYYCCLKDIMSLFIIINYKTLKYSPGIAPEKLSERVDHDLHKQTMSHDISHIFSACFVIFSSVIFITSLPSG